MSTDAAPPSAVSPGWNRTINIALWIIQILLALMFLMAGGFKFANVAMVIQQFDVIGLGQWFRYFTGSVEVLAGLLLLARRTAFYGAVLICCTMVGAVIALLTRLHENPAGPLILLAAALFIAWARRPGRF